MCLRVCTWEPSRAGRCVGTPEASLDAGYSTCTTQLRSVSHDRNNCSEINHAKKDQPVEEILLEKETIYDSTHRLINGLASAVWPVQCLTCIDQVVIKPRPRACLHTTGQEVVYHPLEGFTCRVNR